MIFGFSFSSNLFWLGFLVALSLAAALLFIAKFGLKRFKFKADDLKAAGLNHQQRREWQAAFRRKNRNQKRRR